MTRYETPLHDVVAHSSWATATLLDFCRRLSSQQLELTVPGTYGSVGATLAHLVRAEEAYLARLSGAEPSQSQPASRPDMDELIARGKALATEWHELLGQSLDRRQEVSTMRGKQSVGILIAQVLGHGCEHRAQVCTVLGANGITPPPIDAFSYGQQGLATTR